MPGRAICEAAFWGAFLGELFWGVFWVTSWPAFLGVLFGGPRGVFFFFLGGGGGFVFGGPFGGSPFGGPFFAVGLPATLCVVTVRSSGPGETNSRTVKHLEVTIFLDFPLGNAGRRGRH